MCEDASMMTVTCTPAGAGRTSAGDGALHKAESLFRVLSVGYLEVLVWSDQKEPLLLAVEWSFPRTVFL